MSGETVFTAPDRELNVPMPEPLLWRVLVRPLEAPQVTEGGIHLTDKIQKDQEFVTMVGQIVKIGPKAFEGEKFDGSRMELNDWVLYPTYGGQRIEMGDGRVYILMNDDQMICKVDDPEPYRKKLV